MLSLIATIAAAVFGIAGVLLGERRGSRSQRDHWLRDAQLHACARLADELQTMQVQVARYRRRVRGELDGGPFNQALTAVSLVCDVKVLAAAQRLDTASWRAHAAARRQVPEAEWLEARDLVEVRGRDFIAAARTQLAAHAVTPLTLTGRPARDDPMWDEAHPGSW